MDMFLGLAGLAGLSLFLARWLKKPSALMPLVAVTGSMLWYALFGCLGLLRLGGWLWYALCAAALGWVIAKEKKRIVRLFTPGLVLFIAGGAGFILLFAYTKPMLTQWDEFTFWGAAAKLTTETGQLYTTAPGNLIARSYPPGLIVFTYAMQFFGGAFAEYKMIAAYALVYLAAFAAPTALWRKNRTGAVIIMGSILLLPFLFESGQPGVMNWSYLSCMADAALAALFGGALSFYYAGSEKDEKLLLPLCVVLAGLACIKDVGFALALMAGFVVLLDMVLCVRAEVKFFKLTRWKAAAAAGAGGLAAVVASYFGWITYAGAALKVDVSNIGGGGQSLGMLEMLKKGILALLHIRPDAAFDDRAAKMVDAFVNRPIWMFGSALRLLVLITLLLCLVWALSTDKYQQRRILVFGGAMALCCVAFYIFNIFTYTYVFQGGESEVLKDYQRYLYPFWFGWLMTSITLVGIPANRVPASARRARSMRAISLVLAVLLVGGVGLRVNWQANFASVSPSLYGKRLDVQQVVRTAKEQGMQPEDVVYLISQGDDASRFYMFSYEMESRLVPLYAGPERAQGTTAASLVPPEGESTYAEKVACSPAQLVAYLKAAGCDHILIDVPDEYILNGFEALFTQGFEGWSEEGLYRGGSRYFYIDWDAANAPYGCVFVPMQGDAA